MKTREGKARAIRLGTVAAVVVIAGCGTVAAVNRIAVKTNPVPPAAAAPAAHKQADTVAYVGVKGVTALAQLRETTPDVVTKASSYGDYVDSIGDLRGGTDGKYWSFYIDGKLANVGAGAYTSAGGEKIEWKFQKLQ